MATNDELRAMAMGQVDVEQSEAQARRCPHCWYESDGEHCDRSCEHPACSPCRHADWATANPIDALKEEYDRAWLQAQYAEEAGHDGWRQDVAYAEHLARVLDEIEERREAGAPTEELEEIARHA